MARTQRRQSLGLDQQLIDEPWRFEFFQAVYIIERLAEHGVLKGVPISGRVIGHNTRPDVEAVRFRAHTSRSFPASEIAALRWPDEANENDAVRAEVLVAFMGLIGPSGALPESYLDLVLDRLRLRDTALRDFLDVFNHRTISLFYRAWEKHRPAVGYERAKRDTAQDDPFGRVLASFVGLGAEGLQGRLGIDDDVLRGYAGHFSHHPRNASGLASVLSDLLPVPARIEQFIGDWLYVGVDEQSRLPSPAEPKGRYCQLGVDAVLGERVFDVQGQFAVVLGPTDYESFTALRPDGPRLSKVAALVRMYVGPQFEFVVRVVLAKDEVRQVPLGGAEGLEPHLGWNTWIGDYGKEHDSNDATFSMSA